MNCSYIMTDPSGSTKQEIDETTYRLGYNVRSLDIITMANCNQYNPMKYIKDEADIKNLVEYHFITAMKKEGEQGSSQDPFWDNAMNAFSRRCIALLIDYGDNPNIMDGRYIRDVLQALPSLQGWLQREWMKSSIMILIIRNSAIIQSMKRSLTH